MGDSLIPPHSAPSAETDGFRFVVRVTGADRKLGALASRLESLAAVGVTEVVVDVDWDDERGPRRSLETLRSAVV